MVVVVVVVVVEPPGQGDQVGGLLLVECLVGRLVKAFLTTNFHDE